MALRTVKIDLLMELDKAGASESWYFTGDELSVRDCINNQGKTIALARAEGLGKFAKLAYIRGSDVAVERDALVASVGYQSNTFASNNAYNRADGAGYCWYIRAEGQSFSRRAVHTLFMPDGWFNRKADGLIEPEPSMKDWIANYLAVLRAQQAQLRVLNKTKGENDPHPVDEIANVGGFVQIRATGPVGVVKGDYIQLYNFRGFRPSLTGRHQVTALSGDPVRNITTSKFYNFTASGQILNAYYRLVQMKFAYLLDLVPIRPGTKSVGRAFFLPVGRRKRVSK